MITVKQALKKGTFQLVVLPMLILLGCIFGTSYLVVSKLADPLLTLFGMIGGFILAWIYWSFAVTKWKIWAFENVRNVHELKRKAIQSNLIWRDGHFLGKMAVVSAEQKQQLKRLERKFLEKDVYHDDISVPKETLIYYSKAMTSVGLTIAALLLGGGLFLVVWQDEVSGYVALLVAVFISYKEIKKLLDKNPKIRISDSGIQIKEENFVPWGKIRNEVVFIRRRGKQVSHLMSFEDQAYHEIEIDSLKIKAEQLENLLQVYRVRFEKQNKIR